MMNWIDERDDEGLSDEHSVIQAREDSCGVLRNFANVAGNGSLSSVVACGASNPFSEKEMSLSMVDKSDVGLES